MSYVRKEVLAEGVELYLGDCREVLPTLGHVDVLLTDPPYGINFPYMSYEDTRENLRGLIRFLFAEPRYFERGVVLCGPTQIQEYPAADWVGAITWNTTGSFGKYGYSQWTPVLLYGADLPGFGNVNGVMKTDTYHISGGAAVGFQRSKDEAEHTCPKPMNIMRQMVLRYSSEAETICDPFMGTASTGVAAVNAGRSFIGIEIESKYFDISCRRIEDALRRPDLFIPQPSPKPTQGSLLP